MWNSFQTSDYSGTIAETVSIRGHEGKAVHAYWSRPMNAGPHPGIVLIPHMPTSIRISASARPRRFPPGCGKPDSSMMTA